MSVAKVTKNTAKAARARVNYAKQRLGHHVRKVNTEQPSQMLKIKQTRKLVPIVAELKRQAEMRKQFENFLASQKTTLELNEVNNNNWRWNNYNNNNKKRKTRKLRR